MQQRKPRKNKILFIIGALLILFSGSYLIYNHFTEKKLEQSENNKIDDFFNITVEEQFIEEPPKEEPQKEEKKTINYDYIAVLEIPKINLKKGLVDPSSKYNSISYNVKIINGSQMPDEINGNLILAGHNGSAYISFFKNLYKLNLNDSVFVYYNGIKYEYKIADIYDVDKTGTVKVIRDKDKTTITLITCKKYSNDKQTVFIGYLSNKESY